ncbi:hypothetical protein TCAL_02616 [Tigriopus californicus]|uniref:SET domain-containing protein n=1 Tax=Tigriopus californicus TaxID=6832 RepID=A0A553NFN8_TIGCA|nr:histone-lysine N-methyltransferase SETD7-like [Tigriopus californicus]TRY64272.1 hypothetical protein TCAL_02616 [Tigriopus californicus]|eukprot:TCALIF_02616-PA protein Name:"Similar to setd7 Histone-lysine N-methyltransferase SETD7 (Halocynthia roretzi)" AED:0.17 eAED:0.17 QI:68/1/0.66/1/1/1/3/80/376
MGPKEALIFLTLSVIVISAKRLPKGDLDFETHWVFSSCSLGDTSWQKTFIRSALKSWVTSIQPVRRLKQDSKIIKDARIVGRFHVNDTDYQPLVVGHDDYAWLKYGPEDQGNGWIVGPMKVRESKVTGRGLGFIFPDFHTAIVGDYENDKLFNGHNRNVKAYRCRQGMLELQYEPLKKLSPVFKYEAANETFLTSKPLLMDPYDKRNVYVAPSGIPNAGQGLFAKRTIPAQTLIVTYAGLHVYDEEDLYSEDMTPDEVEDAHKNLMSYDDDYALNIPPDMSSLHQYCSSLGHKVQHKFKNPNADFVFFKHPRFGYVRALGSTRTIQRHEEIFVDYYYSIKGDRCPNWYRTLYHQVFGTKGRPKGNVESDFSRLNFN